MHAIYINSYTHYCYIYHYCSLISIKNFYLKMKHIINHAKSHDLKNFWEAGWFFYLSDDTDTPIWILSNNYSFISQNIKNLASVIILTGRSNRSDRLISVTVIDRSWPVMTGPCPSLVAILTWRVHLASHNVHT